jgi:hypothetical protein
VALGLTHNGINKRMWTPYKRFQKCTILAWDMRGVCEAGTRYADSPAGATAPTPSDGVSVRKGAQEGLGEPGQGQPRGAVGEGRRVRGMSGHQGGEYAGARLELLRGERRFVRGDHVTGQVSASAALCGRRKRRQGDTRSRSGKPEGLRGSMHAYTSSWLAGTALEPALPSLSCRVSANQPAESCPREAPPPAG